MPLKDKQLRSLKNKMDYYKKLGDTKRTKQLQQECDEYVQSSKRKHVDIPSSKASLSSTSTERFTQSQIQEKSSMFTDRVIDTKPDGSSRCVERETKLSNRQEQTTVLERSLMTCIEESTRIYGQKLGLCLNLDEARKEMKLHFIAFSRGDVLPMVGVLQYLDKPLEDYLDLQEEEWIYMDIEEHPDLKGLFLNVKSAIAKVKAERADDILVCSTQSDRLLASQVMKEKGGLERYRKL
jgi:hypothetical protein